MPADFLSCNLINAISWYASQLQQAQSADTLLKAINLFLLNKELPHNVKCQSVIKLFSNGCCIGNDIIWHCIKQQFKPSHVVIFIVLPASLVSDVLADAYGNLFCGKDGIYRTKEYLLQCYYWPGMDADIAAHLKSCHRCQSCCQDNHPLPALLSSIPQLTDPKSTCPC